MVTPREAFDLFKKKFPKARTESVCDCGNFYTVGMSIDGDTSSDVYTIDKKTGTIKEIDFLEQMEIAKSEGEAKIYKF